MLTTEERIEKDFVNYFALVIAYVENKDLTIEEYVERFEYSEDKKEEALKNRNIGKELGETVLKENRYEAFSEWYYEII